MWRDGENWRAEETVSELQEPTVFFRRKSQQTQLAAVSTWDFSTWPGSLAYHRINLC